MLADPALEAKARQLSQELRCLVCRNQSIDDSDADLARDLRILVRQRLQEGAPPEVIKNEIVTRFGDYILLSPPFTWRSVIFMAGTLFGLCLGVSPWFSGTKMGATRSPRSAHPDFVRKSPFRGTYPPP